FAPVLRQIARYLPHHKSENASKTHPKSSHDKFKTASEYIFIWETSYPVTDCGIYSRFRSLDTISARNGEP
ncbi:MULTISPECIES: hypothetical protein, partial [Bacteroides]|uniref:hypothetical protein n=1 Tax=Bacteroides TaxID=816 RepID=UPI001959104B